MRTWHGAVDPERYRDLVDREAARLVLVASFCDLASPVPACPGWDVGELVRHVGSFARRVDGWIQQDEPPMIWPSAPPAGTDLLAWCSVGARALAGRLRVGTPDTPCATWSTDDRTLGFWCRRVAQELVVHRVDVEAAAGLDSAVPADVALDGVDEVLMLMLGNLERLRGRVVLEGTGEVIEVRTGEERWRVALEGASAEVSRGPAGDMEASVSGDPVDLYLWLWGRAPGERLRVAGDAAQAVALRRALRAATT